MPSLRPHIGPRFWQQTIDLVRGARTPEELRPGFRVLGSDDPQLDLTSRPRYWSPGRRANEGEAGRIAAVAAETPG